MEESHKTHRPHIKVGKDEEKKKKIRISCLCAFVVFMKIVQKFDYNVVITFI